MIILACCFSSLQQETETGRVRKIRPVPQVLIILSAKTLPHVVFLLLHHQGSLTKKQTKKMLKGKNNQACAFDSCLLCVTLGIATEMKLQW